MNKPLNSKKVEIDRQRRNNYSLKVSAKSITEVFESCSARNSKNSKSNPGNKLM